MLPHLIHLDNDIQAPAARGWLMYDFKQYFSPKLQVTMMMFLVFLATFWDVLLPSTNNLLAIPRLPRSSSASMMARRCWVRRTWEVWPAVTD